MKLFIQIPCYNEAATLGSVIRELPRSVPGFTTVQWLVIDDGSSDDTASVAREHGVDHVIRFTKNYGLARAFTAGLDACLKLGADVIVNTDADNQYCSRDIGLLVQPILAHQAEIVIGARPIDTINHFSPVKKLLQKLGSWVVRIASNSEVVDAPSGFRAYTRDAAMRVNVFNGFTYTLETIIQAGQKGTAMVSVPVRTNPELRPSRLIKSIPHYLRHSILTIVRIFMAYRPFEFFAIPGLISFILGALLCFRFLYFYSTGGGAGHVQSLILASLLVGIGFSLFLAGLLADLISVNRKLLEDIQYQIRSLSSTRPPER